jgi:K+-sensing histidine kinase KdpD
METNRFHDFVRLLGDSLLAVGAVLALTVLFKAIGSRIIGDAVIALLYLVPVFWSAGRWGLIPGLSAALAAALCFDFLFIPPFYTFTVGSLEDWLVLAIFLGVAVFAVEVIQRTLVQAREAVFMYELSAALAGKRTQEDSARTVARQIRQLYQAARVNVCFRPTEDSQTVTVEDPKDPPASTPPQRIIPIENARRLMGEIQIWRGPYGRLPAAKSRILLNFARQTAEALERTRLMEKSS